MVLRGRQQQADADSGAGRPGGLPADAAGGRGRRQLRRHYGGQRTLSDGDLGLEKDCSQAVSYVDTMEAGGRYQTETCA